MIDFIKRAAAHLVAALVSHASRVARVAIARDLIETFTSAYEEAARLEASGKGQLAQFLRAELDETLTDPAAGDPTPQPALNDQRPFSLPRPESNQAAGEGSSTPRRRGRAARAHGAKTEDLHVPPPQRAADPSTTPISNSNHHI